MRRDGADAVDRWVSHPRTVSMALAALLLCAVTVQVGRDRVFALEPVTGSSLRIRSGEVLARLALSFDPLLADLYWIRAVQEYGAIRRSEVAVKHYERVYPLLDIATTLDPRFNIAYRFGAIFVAEAYPEGPGRPDQAIALLEKGLAAMPERWEYQMDIGFVHYWWLNDYQTAAQYFQRASDVPGAPWWLGPLAANTLAQGGNRDGARMLWHQLLESAGHEWVRTEAMRRLAQLDVLDDLDQLGERIEQFRLEAGHSPVAWEDLGLSEAPHDPYGFPYRLDTATHEAEVSDDSPLLPLPGALLRPTP